MTFGPYGQRNTVPDHPTARWKEFRSPNKRMEKRCLPTWTPHPQTAVREALVVFKALSFLWPVAAA